MSTGILRLGVTMSVQGIPRMFHGFLERILQTWCHDECTGNPGMFHGFLDGILLTWYHGECTGNPGMFHGFIDRLDITVSVWETRDVPWISRGILQT